MVQSVQYFRVSRLTYYFSYMSRLSRICQGRQTSRDVTVCIVDTGTQNKLLFQLCKMLCLHVFSSLSSSETFNSSQCLGTRYEPRYVWEVIAKVSQNHMCFSLITSYGERQEQWHTLRTVARHATQVVKSTKVQLSLSSLLNRHMKD